MTQSADRLRREPVAGSRSSFLVRFILLSTLLVLAGFGWFISQLHSEERKPARQADGIVVLTGGASRVSDALDLLAEGYGKRLLISGVHPANGASDILRSLPDGSRTLLACCVDLDRSAVNTRSNATETRRWVAERGFRSLIVVTSNYHMPRARVELAHAMPNTDLILYPVVSDTWRGEPWWTSATGLRLVFTEYAKYVAAEVRVHLADLGLDLMPDADDAENVVAHKPTTASAN
jgi:uncharacterized SAM-binding protein YcdF (DUF218 family)